MKKNILLIVGGIVLVLAVVLWQLFANPKSIVANVIEDVGSDVLQTEVSVTGVSIDLKGGKAQGGVTADVVAGEITHEMIAAVLNTAAKTGIKKAIEKQKTGFLDKLKSKG